MTSGSENKTKEELMVEDLKDVKEILDRYQIRFWLDWGTLLGAVREGKIIEWDDDIELGAMDTDAEKVNSALPELEKKGFSIRKSPFFIPRIGFMRSGYGIDVCFHSRLDQGNFVLEDYNLVLKGPLSRLFWFIWLPYIAKEKNINLRSPHNKERFMPKDKFKYVLAVSLGYLLSLLPKKLRKVLAQMALNKLVGENCARFIKTIIPSHYFEKLEEINFYGSVFNIPSNPEKYLEDKYGKDWRTPHQGGVWYEKDGVSAWRD